VKTILPPKKRDWKPGTPQVGVFLRTAKGTRIAMTSDRASVDEVALVRLLLLGAHNLTGRERALLRRTLDRIEKHFENANRDAPKKEST
jgi:hypothetical protein